MTAIKFKFQSISLMTKDLQGWCFYVDCIFDYHLPEKAEGDRFSCNFLGTLCYCLFDRCMSFERVLHIIPFCLTILKMTSTKFR